MKNGFSQFLTVVSFCIVMLSFCPRICGQQIEDNLPTQPSKIIKSYRLENPKPINELAGFLLNENAWVDQAINRSMTYLRTNEPDKTLGLADVNSKLALRSAELDNIGITHLRLEQVNKGVPVFGG